jgi:hypothetical protein
MITAIREISTIIERDSKDTTCKFALLKACIEITQQYDHYAVKSENKITFPLGLVILKWLEYYYPIFEFTGFVPQKNGDSLFRSLAFRKHFNRIIPYYQEGLGFLQFHRELKEGKIDKNIQSDLILLIKELRTTITRMPMHYIGGSIGKGGEIFIYNNDSNFKGIGKSLLTEQYLIDHSGSFSIPESYYKAFSILGSFISGTESIIYKWADFTEKADQQNSLNRSEILKMIDPRYSPKRDVNEIKSFYEKLEDKKQLLSVWTGNRIIGDLNIDHVLPYSLWKNNDLWNLVPTSFKDNHDKNDKIPTPELLLRQRELMIYYWELTYKHFPIRFQQETQVALLGKILFDSKNWQKTCMESLIQKCRFLIEVKGFEAYQN